MVNKKTYTIPEFLALQRAQSEIKTNGVSEYIAKKIASDRRVNRMFVFVSGSLIYCKSIIANEEPTSISAVKKIDNAGFTMLSLVRTIGYWICIIMCVIEILRALMQGDTKSIGKIIIKYILAFAAFYFLPWVFDIIKGIFG